MIEIQRVLTFLACNSLFLLVIPIIAGGKRVARSANVQNLGDEKLYFSTLGNITVKIKQWCLLSFQYFSLEMLNKDTNSCDILSQEIFDFIEIYENSEFVFYFFIVI